MYINILYLVVFCSIYEKKYYLKVDKVFNETSDSIYFSLTPLIFREAVCEALILKSQRAITTIDICFCTIHTYQVNKYGHIKHNQ